MLAEFAQARFVSIVLADTAEVWLDLFAQQMGQPHRAATRLLSSDVTQRRCGGASGATGPFYFPAEPTAYFDMAFFATMEKARRRRQLCDSLSGGP